MTTAWTKGNFNNDVGTDDIDDDEAVKDENDNAKDAAIESSNAWLSIAQGHWKCRWVSDSKIKKVNHDLREKHFTMYHKKKEKKNRKIKRQPKNITKNKTKQTNSIKTLAEYDSCGVTHTFPTL